MKNLTGNPASNLNQLANYCYDAAGNLIQNSACPVVTPTYTYDAENRPSTTAGYTYHYDANGVRMEKSNGTSGTMYWPGPGGEYLTETDLTGSTINEEYVYFNGERIARVDRPSGTVHYYFSDQLNSASTITDPSGTVQERYYYYPYGGLVTSVGSDTNHYKFNGKERDSESNLDMFGARYYASSLGRFMTADWSSTPTAVPYAGFGNPQSLNLYAYTKNNPSSLTDPNGHEHCTRGGQEHGSLWCFFHYSDQKEQRDADQARANLSSMRGLAINGQPFSRWAKTATNQQLIQAQRDVVNALAMKPPLEYVVNWMDGASSGIPVVAGVAWTFGAHKSDVTWQNQMKSRGWTSDQITEAIEKGEQFPAPNDVNPGNAATRYVNPTTGRYLVMDNVTHEILQLGGDGFIPK
jgi:RHS repeat-associated protein